MTNSALARSVALFVLAGLMEIGGGYLVWLWLRDHRGFLLGALGGMASGGILGMFVGPVVLALGYKLFTNWVAAHPDSAPAR